MATYYFKGKAMWAECNKLSKYGKYAIKLLVSKEDAKEFKAIGSKAQPKEMDDGSYMLSFSRDPVRRALKNGEMVPAGAPEVLDKDGNPYSGDIGNGSDVTLKVDVFKWDNAFGKGIGMRLDKVRIDNLIEFKKGEQRVAGGNVEDGFQPF